MKKILFSFAFLLHSIVGYAQNVPADMDLYLLIGQSNMAGRGKIDAKHSQVAENIWVVNADYQWVPAKDPLHFDKPTVVGVGPGLEFAKQMQKKNPKRAIGLIPCAVGGSGIDAWVPGVKHKNSGLYAYDDMMACVKVALSNGKIKGIIWHQGENDSYPQLVDTYSGKLEAFFVRLRKDLNATKTPIVLGTLGDFFVRKQPLAAQVNEVILTYKKKKRFAVMSTEGLVDKGDQTHFDTPSYEEMGRRYATEMLKMIQ